MGKTKEKNGVLETHLHERNEGIPFDYNYIKGLHVNKSAVERRAATIGTRRSVKKEWQAAWLLKATHGLITSMNAGP